VVGPRCQIWRRAEFLPRFTPRCFGFTSAPQFRLIDPFMPCGYFKQIIRQGLGVAMLPSLEADAFEKLVA
jgi:hypothetical protein